MAAGNILPLVCMHGVNRIQLQLIATSVLVQTGPSVTGDTLDLATCQPCWLIESQRSLGVA